MVLDFLILEDEFPVAIVVLGFLILEDEFPVDFTSHFRCFDYIHFLVKYWYLHGLENMIF